MWLKEFATSLYIYFPLKSSLLIISIPHDSWLMLLIYSWAGFTDVQLHVYIFSGCRADASEAAIILLPSNITVFTLDFSGSGISGGEHVTLGWNEVCTSTIKELLSEKCEEYATNYDLFDSCFILLFKNTFF